MSANLYRSVNGQVHVKKTCIIEDRGYLSPAHAATSDGNYWFSERGVGVQELVLLGTTEEVLLWLATHYRSGIKNTIKDLPDIYMGVEPYRPGKRFKGLFPMHDVLKAIFDASVGVFGPGNTLTDVINAGGDLKSAITFKPEIGYTEKTKPVKVKGELYIKFSYLPGDKMEKVGSKEVDFRTIRKFLRKLV